MKITDLRVYLTRPKNSTRSWLFVEIDTDEGITGTGDWITIAHLSGENNSSYTLNSLDCNIAVDGVTYNVYNDNIALP